MRYVVEVRLSQDEWEQALTTATPLIEHYLANVATLALSEQTDLLRTLMKTALARHHRWLEEREIGAVISPVEAVERAFRFEFKCGPDALLFFHEFDGLLRSETD